jgi:hypothetical protein
VTTEVIVDGNRLNDAAKRIGAGRRTVLTGGAALALGGLFTGLAPRAARTAKKKPKKAYTCAPPADSEIAFGAGGEARLAQSFTATQTGTLKQISVSVTKQVPTGDYVVQLVKMDGSVPDESPLSVLASATIPDALVPVGTSTLNAKFAATRLTQGTQYAVVVSRPGSNDFVLPSRTGDPCEGGVFSAAGGAPFGPLSDDLIVTVFVTPSR